MAKLADRFRNRRQRFNAALQCECLEDRLVLSQQTGIDYSALLADVRAYDPTKILVRFDNPARAEEVAQRILPGSKLGQTVSLVPGYRSVRLPAGVGVRQALALFQADPGVRYAEPNGYVRVTETIPNDAGFDRLYGMKNTGQGGGTVGADIKATFAWDVSTGGTNVLIANIDTGIDYNHPDLYKNIWVNQGEIPGDRLANLVDTDADGLITFWDLNEPVNQGPGKITDLDGNGRITGADILRAQAGNLGGWADATDLDGNGRTDDLIGWNFAGVSTNNPFDDHGHGSHTAGTHSGMGNNSIGVAGVTWKAQIAIVKFLGGGGGGTWEDSVLAVDYAVTIGSKLSSNSWGGGSENQGLRDAIDRARTAGHLFVAAAGNGNSNVDTASFYPARFSLVLDNVLSVAATDRRDTRASFSNWGRNSVHLGAPGVETYSSVPTGNCSLCDPTGYRNLDGTSMATPHVSGAALLLWNLNPNWSYLEVKTQLLETVDPIDALRVDGPTPVATGGRLNVDRALGLIAAGPRVSQMSPNQPVAGTLSSLRLTFDRTIDVSTFTAEDISNFTDPDGNPIAVDSIEVVPGTNDRQFQINFPMQARAGRYTMQVGPNITDGKGTPMDQNRNGIVGEKVDDQFTARLGILGPRVTGHTPNAGFFEPASSMRVTFSVPMDPATFTLKDIVRFTGPGGDIAVNSVAVVDGTNDRTYEITFDEQSGYGQYTLVIGPDILDVGGNAMDQNNNQILGEVPGDQFTGSFTILNPCFGPDASSYYGCTYIFENASIFGQPGTFTILNAVDDAFAMVDLRNHQFRFYGTTYTGANRLFVNSNGLVTFGTGTAEYFNGDLTGAPAQAALAVLWDDWIKGQGPMVIGRFEDLDGDSIDDRLVIEWNQVIHFGTDGRPITFQVHLYLNTGADTYFMYNYFDLDTGDANRLGASATIGIKTAGNPGNNRILISANQLSPYIRSEHALLFYSIAAGPGSSPGSGSGLDGLALVALDPGEAPLPEVTFHEAAVPTVELPRTTPLEILFDEETLSVERIDADAMAEPWNALGIDLDWLG